jgi:hypothetical protein
MSVLKDIAAKERHRALCMRSRRADTLPYRHRVSGGWTSSGTATSGPAFFVSTVCGPPASVGMGGCDGKH